MDAQSMTDTNSEPAFTNRLAQETSPYLLQHAHNPVDWYPWGSEALERAQSEDKPILLSIGYSACHWCHVMERESFENQDTAKLMNEHFVCIKVDREERPDLDSIYMAATVTLNKGHGGWPMTVFLTPSQQPFFAGTYFPPTENYGRPGFPTILEALNSAWNQDRQGIVRQATNLTTHLIQTEEENRFKTIGPSELTRATAQLAQSFDGIHGGFSPAPKFPAAAAISLLLRRYRSHQDEHSLHMATHTLDQMALGGLYDHLGGGFARYSTDERWLVPHFEKMLYDNALLIRTYCEAWQVTQSPLYERVIRETLDFVLRDLTQENGGFSSALDADTDGEEGRFYVWQKNELSTLLEAEQSNFFAELYDITEEGNWEGKNVLHLSRPLEEEAKERGEDDIPAFINKVDELRATLLKARNTRTQPGEDDKVLTAWNAMMIGAMAMGFQVTGDKRYLEAGIRAADFVHSELTQDEKLLRTYRQGKAHLSAYLEDYAHLGEALIDLYEASGDGRFLTRATAILETMLKDFGEPGGGSFYTTANNHESLILRKREGYDGATPSANAVAACALIRLAQHLGRDDLHQEALASIEAWGHAITEMPRAFSKTLHAVDFILEGPTQIALTGPTSHPSHAPLVRAVHCTFKPNSVLAWEHPLDAQGQAYDAHPVLESRRGALEAQVHICRDFTCSAPETDPEKIHDALFIQADAARSKTMRRPLPGAATPEYTRERALSCFSDTAVSTLGETHLTITPIGFGGYRIVDEVESHCEALEEALAAGINLIDTSTNYSDGRSERLIGRVISKLVRKGTLKREEVVVVSKVGYLQGQNLQNAQSRENPHEDVVEYGDDLWHCIHPSFIKEQISNSIARLGLETIDICLLHNPEYFLLNSHRVGGGTRPQLEAEMRRRIKEAFIQMEKECQAKRIGFYGVSSNTFVDNEKNFTTLSVSECLDIAREVGGESHSFRVVQMPFNLMETGALSERNTGINDAETPLEYAISQNLGVLVNRPLNAIINGTIVRLATPEITPPSVTYPEALTNLHLQEQELRAKLTGEIYSQGETFKLGDFFYFAVEFENYGNQSHNMTSWDEVEYRVVNLRLNRMVEFMQKNLEDQAAKTWQSLFPGYRDALTTALDTLRHRAATESLTQSNTIAEALTDSIPDNKGAAPLSQKALWLTHNVQGINAVLCGMRSSAYVKDILELKNWAPSPTDPELFQRLQKLESKLS